MILKKNPQIPEPITACEPCQAGYYQALTGQSFCDECPENYFANVTSSTKCLPCEAGKSTDHDKQTHCMYAPTGQPTGQPSTTPTKRPSGQPTGQPTTLPTSVPTCYDDCAGPGKPSSGTSGNNDSPVAPSGLDNLTNTSNADLLKYLLTVFGSCCWFIILFMAYRSQKKAHRKDIFLAEGATELSPYEKWQRNEELKSGVQVARVGNAQARQARAPNPAVKKPDSVEMDMGDIYGSADDTMVMNPLSNPAYAKEDLEDEEYYGNEPEEGEEGEEEDGYAGGDYVEAGAPASPAPPAAKPPPPAPAPPAGKKAKKGKK